MKLSQKLSIIRELTTLLQNQKSNTLDIFCEISAISSEITNSERSSLYLYNEDKSVLVTKVAQGLETKIFVNLGQGFAGQCAQTGQSIIENDVQSNPIFNRQIDSETGYTTHKTLVVPIIGKNNAIVGVLQVLNKELTDYNDDDAAVLIIIAQLVSTLVETLEYKKSLQNEVERKTHELNVLNASLQQEVQKQVQANHEKEALLFKQSKMASMGEMIDAIAHQWKQPLNIMSTYNVQMQFMDAHEVTDTFIAEMASKYTKQISHLTTTLNEFRSFLRPNKAAMPFALHDAIESVLTLVADDIKTNALHIEVNIDPSIHIIGMVNEFKHVILNLINNAKDAFLEHNISNRTINFSSSQHLQTLQLFVSDNAGGIPLNIIEKIFDANVTSKEEGKGTGIGLYMSKMIIEKMNGTIEVKTKKGTSTFVLTFTL